MCKNIADFNNIGDYLPILNAILITDLVVILLLNNRAIKSEVLKKWYKNYNLSAVISDVLIIFIGFIITRALYYYVFQTFSIFKFAFLAVIIQVIHDSLFYLFFNNVKKGTNHMLDTFKEYANEVSYYSILADSAMVIIACFIASSIAYFSFNTNIIILIISLYIMPYLIYHFY